MVEAKLLRKKLKNGLIVDKWDLVTIIEKQQAELTEAGGMIGVLREQLQEEIQARADALDDLNNRMMKFMKSYNEMAWKLEEVGGAYTHPVKDKPHPKCDEACMYLCQMRELTDEEITEVATINLGHSMGLLNWMGFARAVLRKAQEK
jgi:hypothetical protein